MTYNEDDNHENDEALWHGLRSPEAEPAAGRLTELADRVAAYVRKHHEALAPAFDDLRALLQLVRAAAERRRAVKAVVLVVAVSALLYVLAPLDGIPDVVPLAGFADDVAVVTLAARRLAGELRAFRIRS